MFTVELVGATELVARLDAMPDTVRALVQAKVQALAIKLQALIVRDKLSGQVLKVQTGALRRSIHEVVETNGDSVVGRVFSSGDVKYAAIQEYGGTTPPHDILPKKADALAFMAGGKLTFAKIVHHPGSHIPAHSFMRGSLAEMAPEITMELKSAVIRGMQQSVNG